MISEDIFPRLKKECDQTCPDTKWCLEEIARLRAENKKLLRLKVSVETWANAPRGHRDDDMRLLSALEKLKPKTKGTSQ